LIYKILKDKMNFCESSVFVWASDSLTDFYPFCATDLIARFYLALIFEAKTVYQSLF